MAIFEAYITNRGLYTNYGAEVGEHLQFPTTAEEVKSLFSRIGIDGTRYQEYFITSYESDVAGLGKYLGEQESLDELNYLAVLLSQLSWSELEIFEAAVNKGDCTANVGELINLAQNLDCYAFFTGVFDDETLGRIYAEDMGAIEIPLHLRGYFDYEAYGRDIRINEGGCFVCNGYAVRTGSPFVERYAGLEDIPEEYRISGIHQQNKKKETHSILASLKQFKEALPVPHQEKAGPSHEER